MGSRLGCLSLNAFTPLQTDSRVSRGDEIQELVAVLANEWLYVMTGNVVPFNAVVVEVVKNGQAGFIVTL